MLFSRKVINMKKLTSDFRVARRFVWGFLLFLVVYLILCSHNQPTRADIMSETGGQTVYMELLWNNVYALVPFVLLSVMALGCTVILMSLWRVLTHKMRDAILCLNEFILAAAIWVLTDSYLLSFVTAKANTVALISYISFTSMLAFLLEFMIILLGKRKSLDLLCVFFYVFALLEALSFVFPVLSRFALLVPVHIGCLVGAALILFYGFAEAKKRRHKEIRWMLRGFLWLIILVVVALILFYLGAKAWYSMAYTVGICIFCMHLLVAALGIVKRQIENEATELAYRKMAYTDSMTGLFNKSAYMEEEKKEPTPGTIYIMLDINDLKSINDEFGHRTGDDVIITAAHFIQKHFDDCLCYRFGGDEFVVISKTLSEDQVKERLEQMHAEMTLGNEDRKVPVVLAAGYSHFIPGDTMDDLFRRSDEAMYENKAMLKAEPMLP